MGKLIDLTGRRFGRLTVIERVENHITSGGHPAVKWRCKCDCGNYVDVVSGRLLTGNTKSCGCQFWDGVRKTKNRKQNIYEIHDDYIVGITTAGDRFVFDKEDYEKVKQYCWRIGTKEGYLTAREYGSGKLILLHRLILNAPQGICVDHINHDPADNRKVNLRLATITQNMRNTKLPSNNTSGHRGVSLHKMTGKWNVSIGVNGKQVYVGLFSDINDAVAARKAAEEKYYGPYSYDNSIAAVPRIAV